MSKWKIDKRNEETDSSSVDIEGAIKKAKLLRVINIICYICTAILFVFFVIGGVRSCKNKSNVVDNTPHIQRVIVTPQQHFALENEDFYNEYLFNDLCGALQDTGEIFYEDEEEEPLQVGTLDTSLEIYSIRTIEYLDYNDNSSICFYDFNDDSHIWYFDNGVATIESSDENYGIEGLSFYFSLSSGYIKEEFNPLYVVLDNYYVGYNEGIFDAITDTVSNFTVTLGLGINAILVLFYANNQLTVLGTITVIVVGVALVYFLIRFIFGLIRLRG